MEGNHSWVLGQQMLDPPVDNDGIIPETGFDR
jgi:hypothetical protein